MAWPTTDDGEFYIFDGQVLMPVDPSTNAPILMLRPQGGMAVGIPAIEKGDPGKFTLFQADVDFTSLAWDDPTPADAQVLEVTPGSDTVSQVVKLALQLHEGEPGADGSTSIDLGSIGGTGPVAGQTIEINGSADGFIFSERRVVDRCIPASISNTAAGNSNSTLATVPIPARSYDRRLLVTGHTIYTQNGGSNVVVDLVARLNNQTGGNVIARCQGIGPGTGGMERLAFSSAIPAGSVDAFDKVAAGSGATVYIRTEQQSGSNSYTTSNSSTFAEVWAIPVS